MRIGVVLSAGGLRGAAHIGVLRRLVAERIPIDVLVGVSAGAVIAAYYAAAGLSLEELAADAVNFRGRHLLLHGVNVQLRRQFERALAPRCGVIPDRLRQLESARFDTLHHGISALGIGCHDVLTDRPQYFATGADGGVALHEVVRASASIPMLFPSIPVVSDRGRLLLTDGGVSDPVPIAFARRPPLAATHTIVSDCRWIGTRPLVDEHTVWIRPRLPGVGTIWTRYGLASAVRQGEAAVTHEVVARIRAWLADGVDGTSDPRRPAASGIE
jgi:predicted acylesterase/phospholipase RssA